MTQLKSEKLLKYKGNLTFDTIDELLTKYKAVIEPVSLDLVIRKRLYSIMVECLENTYRHTSKIPDNLTHDVVELELTLHDENFVFRIGNYIDKTKIDDLTSKIDLVNSLDQAGLNKLYKASISKARISDKGGAGLGIIEISRNSRQKIKYYIGKAEQDFVFFKFEVRLFKHPNKLV